MELAYSQKPVVNITAKSNITYKVISRSPHGMHLEVKFNAFGTPRMVQLQKFGTRWDIVRVCCPDGWPVCVPNKVAEFCRELAPTLCAG